MIYPTLPHKINIPLLPWLVLKLDDYFWFYEGTLDPLNFLNGCGLIMLSLFVVGGFDFCMGRREFSAACVSMVACTGHRPILNISI
jgi:hypothetical protein